MRHYLGLTSGVIRQFVVFKSDAMAWRSESHFRFAANNKMRVRVMGCLIRRLCNI